MWPDWTLYTAERTLGFVSGGLIGAIIGMALTNSPNEIELMEFTAVIIVAIVLIAVSIVIGLRRGDHK